MNEPDSSKPKRRRFKNPESFRERAVKASEVKAKPDSETSRLQQPANALRRVFSPLTNGYLKLKKVKQLKPVFKVLSFIGRIIFPRYLRTSLAELKKVTWPSFKQSRRLTYAVLIFAIVFGATVAIVDWGLGKIFKNLLLK